VPKSLECALSFLLFWVQFQIFQYIGHHFNFRVPYKYKIYSHTFKYMLFYTRGPLTHLMIYVILEEISRYNTMQRFLISRKLTLYSIGIITEKKAFETDRQFFYGLKNFNESQLSQI
jgi:hypothetical protein